MKKGSALNKLLLCSFLSLLTGGIFAQPLTDSSVINISKIGQFEPVDKYQIFIDSTVSLPMESILNEKWNSNSAYNLEKNIPNSWTTSTIYLKYFLENNQDSSRKIYFLAGTYIKKIKIYKLLMNNKFIQLQDESRKDGYQPIQLIGREKAEFIVKINFSKRPRNELTPTFINPDYLKKFKLLRHYNGSGYPVISYITSGILIMMMGYCVIKLLGSTNKKTYLYVFLYCSSMFTMILLNALLKRQSGELSSFFSEYLQFALLVVGTIFYIDFSREFLETKVKLPLINSILQIEKYSLIVILISYTFVVYFTNYFMLQEAIESGTKKYLTFIAVLYISFCFFKANKSVNYIAFGNLILVICAIISYLIHIDLLPKGGIFENSTLFLEMGLVGLLAVFLLGAEHKERNSLIAMIKEQEALKKEWANKNFEIQIALLKSRQNERNRISMEMHDDLGAGITTIRLYSELAKKRMGGNVIPEIEKISSSANELINNMNSLIWTMSPENDTLHNMIAYIRSYGIAYFEDAEINCQINIDENIPDTSVTGEKRRNIFLAIKEILNNIIKHSKATEVIVTLKKENNYLVLCIHDNGIGINTGDLRKFGNGLKNIKKRMEDMQLEFSIENNNGTLVIIKNKLN